MSPISGQTIFEVAAALLDDVVAALDAQGAKAPCRVLLSPYTAIADDSCCESPDGSCGGQLAVTVDEVARSDNFPLPIALSSPSACGCGGDPYLTLKVRLSRCVPVVDNSGAAPSVEALTSAAAYSFLDAAAISNGVCAFSERGGRVVPGPVVAFGPEGGCGAYEALVTVDPDELDTTITA